MNPDSPHAADRPPHPLAIALIERLAARPGARVLEIGAGSGRNTAALTRAGFTVVRPSEASPASCAAALTTHALLHGTPSTVVEQLASIATALEPGGLTYATFGSTHDARYGLGEQREPFVFVPLDGDEAGIAHTYYDETRLRTALAERFIIESLQETPVDDVAGTWAHPNAPLHGAIHWFARLRRRA